VLLSGRQGSFFSLRDGEWRERSGTIYVGSHIERLYVLSENGQTAM